ncbi:MAG: hypothetical protein AB4372_09950 [Xenococcus sp. (in: cyanobacteria)]
MGKRTAPLEVPSSIGTEQEQLEYHEGSSLCSFLSLGKPALSAKHQCREKSQITNCPTPPVAPATKIKSLLDINRPKVSSKPDS